VTLAGQAATPRITAEAAGPVRLFLLNLLSAEISVP